MPIIRKKGRARQRTAAKQRPKTVQEYYAKPADFQERWNRVAHVITRMRTGGVSLQQAAREYGIDPRTVVRLGKPALRKRTNGRYAAKASDQLLRVLAIPTPQGVAEIAIRDSRAATQLAEYWTAVQWFLDTGDASALKPFRGKSITDASGKRIKLLTNLDQLERLGSAGVLSFESLYGKAA